VLRHRPHFRGTLAPVYDPVFFPPAELLIRSPRLRGEEGWGDGRKRSHSNTSPSCIGGATYFSRLQVTSLLPPIVPEIAHFISPPENERICRRCSVPFQAGQVPPSILCVRTLSCTVYVPKKALLPRTIAAFSSGVPVIRLLDANLGRSDRVVIRAKRPPLSKI
jgi:hypothetical protein